MLIRHLLLHRWTRQSTSDLQKYDVEQLRQKLGYCLERYGTVQQRQALEESIRRDKAHREEKRSDQRTKTRERRDAILKAGLAYFVPGAKVQLFDEKPTEQYGRTIRKLAPLQVKVTHQTPDGKEITVEFLDSRPWYEAGGHWVQKGQTMKFKFDSITCTWLREGLTPEVVRSIGPSGKSLYFELSYTRQYLLLPEVDRKPVATP